nr:pre-mRNA-splicing factor cwc22-like [Lolium perenne]
MSSTPRGRSSSRRRTRCKCLGGGGSGGKPSTPCCFNPLRSLFRCPGRGRGRSRSRSKSRNRAAPSRVSSDVGTEQQGQEPSFFVYSMGNAPENSKKKKHRKARLPSIRSCFRSKKKERKANARRQPLTPAPSMVTHPPRSPPAPQESTPAVTVTQTQPPSPAFAETGNVNSPATPDRRPAPTGPPGKQPSTDSAWPPFTPQRQHQVEGLQIVEVAMGDRLSAHDAALIEMVESSIDDSAESSMKSSLEFINEPSPQRPGKPRMVAAREVAVAVKATAREAPRLWLNGNAEKAGAGARFSEPLVMAEANELWAHDIACSRAHADMLADTDGQ